MNSPLTPSTYYRPSNLGGLVVGGLTFNHNEDPSVGAIDLQTGARVFGKQAGYATLDLALTDLQRATAKPSSGAAAVVERDGRFFGTAIRELTFRSTHHGGDEEVTARPFVLQRGDGSLDHSQLSRFEFDPSNAIRAVVDGPALLVRKA